MLRNILLAIGIIAVVFSVLIFSGKISVGGKKNKAMGDVMMWGTVPETKIAPILQEFNPQAQTYAVRYRYIAEKEFDQKLLEALASGTGPDMILAPYQTILSQTKRIYPYPITSLGEKSFKDRFVDGASIFFTPYGALALPVSIDPMVLMYNRSMLSKNGYSYPPVSWDELAPMAERITKRERNQFIESAISLGTPNTPYAKDIIMTLVMQLGQSPVIPSYDTVNNELRFYVTANTALTTNPSIQPLSTVSRFFASFGDPGQVIYSWNDSLGSARDRFVAERLAMYIGYAGELKEIRGENPKGEFEMTILPQTKGYSTFVTGMRMYGIAVLRSSKNMNTAFSVQSQFSDVGVSPALAAAIGGVPALRSFSGNPSLDETVAKSMLVARGWYDIRQAESSFYTSTLISDIINYRQGVVEAVGVFVNRLQDLYDKR